MEQHKTGMEIEVEPMRLLGAVLRRSWLIGLCALICAAAVAAAAFLFVGPQYRSSVMFYINNDIYGTNITTSDISASKRLAESCVAILNTRTTMDLVARQAGVSRTYEEMLEIVEAYGLEDTVLLEAVVTSGDPQEAFAIAGAIAEVLPERIDNAFTGVSASVVDDPMLAVEPSGPEYLKLAVIGFCAGLVLSAAGVVAYQIVTDVKK